MKIAIEAQRIFRDNKHGMDFVALESIKELQQIDHKNEYYIFVSPGPDRCLKETENFHIIELKCPTYPLWEQWALPKAIKKLKPALLHCTSNTAPIYCSVPLVLTLHDIIFLEPRQNSSKSWYQEMGWYYRRFVVPRILNKCKKIITVSKFECNRIKNTLGLDNDVITSVYNGYNSHFCQGTYNNEVIKKYISADNYLFFLGNTDPKKNAPRVLKAYKLYLDKSNKKLPLLIADLKEEYLDKILEAENIKDIKSNIYFPGYISNKDLPDIYRKASAFLYPSLRESFGIPMLEAMACCTPVIAGNTSAMPEIVGDSALLADPFSHEDIARQLLRLEQENGLKEKIIASGLQRVEQFSWRHTAESLLDIYKSINNQDK